MSRLKTKAYTGNQVTNVAMTQTTGNVEDNEKNSAPIDWAAFTLIGEAE